MELLYYIKDFSQYEHVLWVEPSTILFLAMVATIDEGSKEGKCRIF